MNPFSISGKEFGFLSPYIIAEIGVNHEGDLDRAKRMIEACAGGGAHAAKFQTYKADLLATKHSSPSYWDQTKEAAASQHALFQRWDNFGEFEYRELARTCRDCGVDFMSTPFDLTSVDLVADLAPVMKIASADVTNIPLLRAVGASERPVIMSTGACRFDEIATAIAELEAAGCKTLALLHCVLNYPTHPTQAQMAIIPELMRLFGREHSVGYSDHVKPNDDGQMPALEMATLFGSVILEKHFTDDKTATGNDHYHAMDKSDLAAFVGRLSLFRDLYGSAQRDLAAEAAAISNARRRIVAAVDLRKGDLIREDSVVALRSNQGVEISHWDRVIGKTLCKDVAHGVPFEWEDFR